MAGSTTSIPNTTISLSPGSTALTIDDRRCLIFGQKTATGTAVAEELNINMQLATKSDIKALFGTGDLYYKILAWRAAVQVDDGGKLPQLDVVSIDPAVASVAATSTVQFTGTASADGSFTVSIVDEKAFSIVVPVVSGDDGDALAAKLNASIAALTDLPFTAVVLTDTVTITTLDTGTIGNTFGVRVTGTATDVTPVLTAFTGGATDPVLTTILDVIDGLRYTGVQWPEVFLLDTIATEFANRFNVANKIMDGTVFQGSSDTFANNKITADALNNQTVVLMGNNVTATALDQSPSIMQPADWVASFFIGVRAKRLTTDAQIADLVVATVATGDKRGGIALASLPYHNTSLTNTPVTSSSGLYNSTEQGELADSGFTTYGVNDARNGMVTGLVRTTWKTDSAGNENKSFSNLTYVDTGSVCREVFFKTLKAKYAQMRLTDGNVIAGRSMVNAAFIKAELISIYKVLAANALVSDDGGVYFDENTTVVTNLSTNSVQIDSILPIVTGIERIDYAITMKLGLN